MYGYEMNEYGYDDTHPVEVNLSQIMEDRKAERKMKVEQRRQTGLQRIRDMRSTTGIDPLQLFPQVVWEKVLDKLDPEGRRNIWQVHPLFRDMMASTQIRDILLPLAYYLCKAGVDIGIDDLGIFGRPSQSWRLSMLRV